MIDRKMIDENNLLFVYFMTMIDNTCKTYNELDVLL
jgi:hypothetical protein